jgi:hypothetical protein
MCKSQSDGYLHHNLGVGPISRKLDLAFGSFGWLLTVLRPAQEYFT